MTQTPVEVGRRARAGSVVAGTAGGDPLDVVAQASSNPAATPRCAAGDAA
jgi:hypothetical protein